jgi:hypothetical protein
VLRDRKPQFAVEVKTGERGPSRAVRYFKERTAVPSWYQVHLGTEDVVVDGVRRLPFEKFCQELAIP